MTSESVQTSSNIGSKINDKRVVGLFVGGAFLLLILLSLISAGAYYWYKNSKISDKIAKEGASLIEELSKVAEEPSGFSNTETPESTGSQNMESGAPNNANGSANSSNAKSSSSVEVKIDYNSAPQPSQAKTCYKYTIYEGPFKSSKCYTRDDYYALSYYVTKYDSAEFSKKSAESTIKFTCDKEYFKESCENAREQKDKAKKDMEKYAKEINQIISRGW